MFCTFRLGRKRVQIKINDGKIQTFNCQKCTRFVNVIREFKWYW